MFCTVDSPFRTVDPLCTTDSPFVLAQQPFHACSAALSQVLERFVSSLQLREANAASAAAAAAGLALPPATPPPLLGSTLSVRAVKVGQEGNAMLASIVFSAPSGALVHL
eukprot:scaffold84784_cov37-Tisochrysis_lutea.AAC.2